MNIENLNPNIATGMSAVLGSLVGALASLASTWFTLRHQGGRDNLSRQRSRREALYSNFVTEAARMYSDALVRTLGTVQSMAILWSLLAQIRFSGSQSVLAAAEKIAKAIFDQYEAPNLNAEQIRARFSKSGDPLNEFSLACREELDGLDRFR